MNLHTKPALLRRYLLSGFSILLILSAFILPACSSGTDENTGQGSSQQESSQQEPAEQNGISSSVFTLDATEVTNSSAIMWGEAESMDSSSPMTVSFEYGWNGQPLYMNERI